MVEWLPYIIGGVVGFLLGELKAAIMFEIRESRTSKERMSIFDKALTQGDGARLYNLRVAEKVSEDTRTLNNAVEREITPPQQQDEEAKSPWSDHPVYGSCEITLDIDRGVASIINEGAADGPDYWEEPLDEFMSQFEGEPSMP